MAGYAATFVTHMVLMLLVTRLGRKLLMNGDYVSAVYTVLLCLVWFVAAGAGAYVCFRMSPLPPYGAIGFPFMLALVSITVMVRNARQLKGQQSAPATAAVVCTIVGATAATLNVCHAFTF